MSTIITFDTRRRTLVQGRKNDVAPPAVNAEHDRRLRNICERFLVLAVDKRNIASFMLELNEGFLTRHGA